MADIFTLLYQLNDVKTLTSSRRLIYIDNCMSASHLFTVLYIDWLVLVTCDHAVKEFSFIIGNCSSLIHTAVAHYHFISLCLVYLYADQRDAVQKKTFTKWVNKHLVKVFMKKTFNWYVLIVMVYLIDVPCNGHTIPTPSCKVVC